MSVPAAGVLSQSSLGISDVPQGSIIVRRTQPTVLHWCHSPLLSSPLRRLPSHYLHRWRSYCSQCIICFRSRMNLSLPTMSVPIFPWLRCFRPVRRSLVPGPPIPYLRLGRANGSLKVHTKISQPKFLSVDMRILWYTTVEKFQTVPTQSDCSKISLSILWKHSNG